MGRSGYVDDCDEWSPFQELYPSILRRSIEGKRGQAFLHELATAMDAMPEKKLIAEVLVTRDGQCCTMGVICKTRGIDVSKIAYDDQAEVGKALGISESMARSIAFHNDDDFGEETDGDETPEARWIRMRKWVNEQLKEPK